MRYLFLVLEISIRIFLPVPITDPSSIRANPDALLAIFAKRQCKIMYKGIGNEGVAPYGAEPVFPGFYNIDAATQSAYPLAAILILVNREDRITGKQVLVVRPYQPVNF